MRKLIVISLLLCVYIATRGQTGYEYDYWFDDDRTTLQTIQLESASCHIEADMSQLDETLHAIHIQVRNAKGVSSIPISRYFIKSPESSISHFRYWFDQDSSYVRTESLADGVGFMNIGYLQDGFHVLHVQVEGGKGGLSVPMSRPFLKVPQVMFTDYLTCRFVVDGQFYKQKLVSSHGGIVSLDLDVADLSQGLHRLYIQVLTPSGTVTATYSKFFLRVITDKERAALKCYYAFDNGEYYAQKGTVTGNTNHFDIDVSQLNDGEHHFTYYLSDGSDVSIFSKDADFLKYIRGDVNSDGYIDVADLSGVVHFILEIPTEKLIFAAADLDENETVDVNDFSGMANLILSQSYESHNVRLFKIPALEEQLVDVSNLQLDKLGEGELFIHLVENRRFAGLQFDLTLPDGVRLIEDGVQADDKKHSCWVRQHDDGSYRIVCASIDNTVFGKGTILRLQIKGDGNGVGTANVNNIILTDTEANRYTSASVQSEISGTTHLASIAGQNLTVSTSQGSLILLSSKNLIVHVVSMSGGLVAEVPVIAGKTSSVQLPAGIYIVDNKKVIIR